MRSVGQAATLRAAIYVRVSTSGQEENYSPKTQEDACQRYCAEEGFEVAENQIYCEVFSGAALYERPELSRLRAAVRQGLVQAVVCYSLDRLSRKQTHVAILADEFERADCRLRFVTEDFEEGAVGTFIRNAKAFAAELEREKTRERTGRGLLERVRSGKPRPGNKAPYGYVWRDAAKSGFVPDPETAPTVGWIFRSLADGNPLRKIASVLTEQGIRSPRGLPAWGFTTVGAIARNRIYTGQAVAWKLVSVKTPSGKRTMKPRPAEEHVPLPDDVAPALVDRAIFDVVQTRLRLNKEQAARSNPYPEVTLLRAGYARCGHCGGPMGVNRKKQYMLYRCSRHVARQGSCAGSAISAATLDDAAWSKISALLTDPTVIGKELERMRRDDPTEKDLARVDTLIAQAERKRENLLGHLAHLDPESASGIYVQLEQLTATRKGLLEERELISARQRAWEQAQHQLSELEAWCRTVADNLKDLTYEQKRLALNALGVTVRVYRADHSPRYEIEASIDGREEPLAYRSLW